MKSHRSDPRHIAQKSDPIKDKQGKLERIASKIDPPSREIDDRDLIDPGRMTPKSPPTDNRS